jgi:dodecin
MPRSSQAPALDSHARFGSNAAHAATTMLAARTTEAAMSDHVYRVIEVVGSSPDGVDAAVRNAVERAARTTRNLDWFEVTQIRGHLEDGRVAHLQVGVKLGFRIDDQIDDEQG